MKLRNKKTKNCLNQLKTKRITIKGKVCFPSFLKIILSDVLFIDFFSKLIKKALRKFSISEDDQNATDNEQHDSLPEDPVSVKPPNRKPRPSWGGFEFQDIAKQALQMKNSSEYTDNKHVQIKVIQNTPDLDTASTSKRKDSDASVWSDNIPVITISKTESAENILNNDKVSKMFKPKIRCALKKQSTEVDEELIRYFNNDIEKNISDSETVKELIAKTGVSVEDSFDFNEDRDLFKEQNKCEETVIERSSSDDTENKDESVETILSANSSDGK